jgi:hypothetical protein
MESNILSHSIHHTIGRKSTNCASFYIVGLPRKLIFSKFWAKKMKFYPQVWIFTINNFVEKDYHIRNQHQKLRRLIYNFADSDDSELFRMLTRNGG